MQLIEYALSKTEFSQYKQIIIALMSNYPNNIMQVFISPLYSNFVSSASCVPDAYTSPKIQNNSWHASRGTQRLIDRSI